MQAYKVGDRFFSYKVDAGEYAARTNSKVQYLFYDETFSRIDWRHPVPYDLDMLYATRAQQLRDRYDYLILAYSGGSDSQNVLDTFIDNGIHIDEIVIWHDKDITHTEDNRTNREALGVAYVRAQKIVDLNPRIKLRLIGSMQAINEFYSAADFDQQWQIMQPHASVMVPQRRGYWKNQIPEYKKLIDQNKTVGVIWGYDRPTIKYDQTNDKFYHVFEDRVQGYQASTIDLPIDNIMFYWCPEMPLMTVKMAQKMVEKMRLIPPEFKDPYFAAYRQVNMLDKCTVPSGATISRTLIQSWIYPKWDPRTFTDGKCAGNTIINTDMDYWIADRSTEEPVKKWMKSLISYKKSYNTWYERFNGSNGWAISRRYYLE